MSHDTMLDKDAYVALWAAAIPAPPPFNFLAAAVKYDLEYLLREGEDHSSGESIWDTLEVPIPPCPPLPPMPNPPVPQDFNFEDEIEASQETLAGKYVPIQLKGFSSLRPEILAVTDFSPAYDDDLAIMPAGEKIEIFRQIQILRDFNVRQLLRELKRDPEAKRIIRAIEKRYDVMLRGLGLDLRALAAFFVNAHRARNVLNIRKVGAKLTMRLLPTSPGDWTMVNYVGILKAFGYGEDNISEFSNSKILMQIVGDFAATAVNHSPFFLRSVEEASGDLADRMSDDDPFDLDPLGASAVLNALRLPVGPLHGPHAVKHWQEVSTAFWFWSSTGATRQATGRLKFILNFISKELIVSSQLGNTTVKNLLRNKFDSDNIGNPFDNILGIMGREVTTTVAASNSILSLFNFRDQNEFLILPFESPLTPKDANNNFATGIEFFIDSIISGQSYVDPQAFISLINKANSRSASAKAAIDGLFAMGRGTSARRTQVTATAIFDNIGNVFATKLTRAAPAIASDDYGFPVEAMQLAILNLCSTNIELKSAVFSFLLLAGLKDQGYAAQTGKWTTLYKQISLADVLLLEDIPQLEGTYSGPGSANQNVTKNGIPGDSMETLTAIIIDKIVELTEGTSPEHDSYEDRTGMNRSELATAFYHNSQDPRGFWHGIGSGLNSYITLARQGFKGASDEEYYLPDGTFRTRLNGIGPTSLLMLFFEAYVQMGKLSGISFHSSRRSGGYIQSSGATSGYTTNTFYFSYDAGRANAMLAAFGSAAAFPAAEDPPTTSTGMAGMLAGASFEPAAGPAGIDESSLDELGMIKYGLGKESRIISKLSNYIFEYFKMLKAETAPLLEMNKAVRGRWGTGQNSAIDRVRALRERPDAADLFASLNKGQLALSIRQLVEVYRSTSGRSAHRNISSFSDPSFLSKEMRDLLLSMLKAPQFRKSISENLKIVTVGLPAGLTTKLDSFKMQDENTPGKSSELDVISIFVFRRDLQYEDLVFKPMSYTFELSRFTQVIPGTSLKERNKFFGKAQSHLGDGAVKTFNLQVDENFDWSELNARSDVIKTVASDTAYDFMTPKEKVGMFQNHVVSYFLGVYLRMLTEMDFRESSFLLNESIATLKASDADRAKFVDLMMRRVKQIAGNATSLDDLRKSDRQLDKLLNRLDNKDTTEAVTGKVTAAFKDLDRKANISLSENVTNFISSFKPDSMLTGADVTEARIISPKTFERIFHIPVDIDDFAIDVDETLSTTTGKQAYELLTNTGQLIRCVDGEIRMSPRSSLEGDHVMSELFVSLDTKFSDQLTFATIQNPLFSFNGGSGSTVVNDGLNS